MGLFHFIVEGLQKQGQAANLDSPCPARCGPLPARPHLLKAPQLPQCTTTPSKSTVNDLISSLDHINQACIFKGARQFPGLGRIWGKHGLQLEGSTS